MRPASKVIVALTAGSLMPMGARRSLTIRASGLCVGREQPRRDRRHRIVRRFYLGRQGLDYVMQLLDASPVWSVTSQDSGAMDGDFIEVELRGHERHHIVLLRNTPNPAVEKFVGQINELMPDELQLHYNALDRRDLGAILT